MFSLRVLFAEGVDFHHNLLFLHCPRPPPRSANSLEYRRGRNKLPMRSHPMVEAVAGIHRRRSMSVSHEKGDLFEVANRKAFDDWAIAHCISEDCVMGKGIATEFKKRYGGVPELKKQVADGKKTGKCAFLEKDGRIICYLITKKVFRDKPTYESIEESLKDMFSHLSSRSVPGVLMPRIGCGLDRLLWPKVEPIIDSSAASAGVAVVVVTL